MKLGKAKEGELIRILTGNLGFSTRRIYLVGKRARDTQHGLCVYIHGNVLDKSDTYILESKLYEVEVVGKMHVKPIKNRK